MGLRQGDRITIRRSARVQLTQYDSLTPSVTIQREIGADPAADIAEMERIAYVELRRAVIEELLTRRKFEKIMGDDGKVTLLLKHCEKAVRRGYDNSQAGLGILADEGAEQSIHTEERSRSGATRRKKARRD